MLRFFTHIVVIALLILISNWYFEYCISRDFPGVLALAAGLAIGVLNIFYLKKLIKDLTIYINPKNQQTK